MWEILSYGEIPYSSFNNQTAREKVLEGYRMPKPDICPDEFYEIMKSCWYEQPDLRPSKLFGVVFLCIRFPGAWKTS